MNKGAKMLALTIAAAMAGSVLAGCGTEKAADATPSSTTAATAAATTAPAKKQTIRVESTFTGADPWTPVWQAALKDFMAKNPNIEVVDEATPAAGDAFKTKLNTDFASGNEPDVAYGFNGTIGQPIVSSGKVVDWDGYLKEDAAWAGNFSKGALDAVKFNDKVYALPYIGFFEGMWVNKDVFKSAGLEVPKTYEDILKAIPVLKAKDIVPIACSFAEEPHYIIETFVLSMGGKAGHGNDFDASWAPALNMIKELYDKGAFTKDAMTVKQAACAQLLSDKKAAMFVSGSWSAGQFKDAQNTAVIPLPLVTGGKADANDIIGGFGTGWYMVKSLNDKKDGAGLKYVKYMTSPDVMGKFIEVAGSPALKCNLPNSTPIKQSGIDLVSNAKSVSSPLGDRINQEAFTTIWKGLSYVVTGKKTSEQLLDEAKKLNVKK